MKKILLFVLLLAPACWAQTHPIGGLNTDNLWTGFQTFQKPVVLGYTVATLPAAPLAYQVAIVSDGSSSTDCTTGLGTSYVLCAYVNGAWSPIGGAGGGGAGNPGGSGTQLQYRSGSSFGGIAGSSFAGGVLTLPATTFTDAVKIANNSTSASQVIGFNIEQGLNPTADVSAYDFGQGTELFTLSANAKNFTGQLLGSYGSFSHFGSGSLNSVYGGAFEAFNSGPATSVTLVEGVSGTANNGGVNAGSPVQTATNNGGAANLRGIGGTANNSSSGTVTNAVAVYAEANHNTGGGAITNNYGVFVAAQTAGVNNTAIFTTGSAPSVFGGQVTATGGVNIPTGQLYQINSTNLLDTDAAMAGNSSTRAPSQSAVISYVLARTGATTSLSALTNPSANKSFDMAANTLNFGWSVNTGASNLFTLTDFASNTGTGYLANFPTAASSTLKPFRTCYRGTTDCVVLNTTTLTTTGATVIDATKLSGNLPAISGASLTSVDAATLGTHAAAFFQTALGFTPAHADLSTGTSAANVVGLFNTGTCSGYLKSDGTCDVPTGAGTVTHTGGALTLNKVMLGAGTADSKVDSALTSDGAGTITGGVSITSTTFVGALTGNASTATAATTVTNADDTTTNADFYPLFTPTVGGNQAAKVSSTKLIFHPSTGLLTATGFSGPLTGNVTGNASGTAATFTGSLTGAVTSTGMATVPGKLDVGTSNAFCSDAGANDTYACNLSPAVTAYVTGTRYRFKANTANTGAASINFNAVGALTIKKLQGAITTDLADNDIRVGQWVECVYDGTNCQMVSPLGNNPSASLIGTDTQVVFFDGANNPVGNSQMTYNKTTNLLTVGSVATTGATADVFTPLADGTTANSFWLSSTTANVFKAYVGGALKQFAFVDSNITGTAATITGAVTLANTPLTARGDLLIATTATPILGKLAKGTQYQTLQGGATDPLYDAVHLDQATAVTGSLPWASQAHTAANVVALWTTCTGYLKNDGTCDVPAGVGTVTHTGSLNASTNAVPVGSGAADLTASSCTITAGVMTCGLTGNVTGNASGTAASITGSLTGDVTSSAMATTLANIPTTVTMAGKITATNIAAPASPSAGTDALFTDSTDLRFHDKNASGVIGTTVVADTGAANNYVTGITAAGAVTKERPTCSKLSDAGTGCSATIANYVSAASNATAAKQILVSGGADKTTNYIDFPDVKIIPAANCNNATAGSGWSIASTFTPTCRAGTNNLNGVLNAIPSTGATGYFDFELPGDWDTATKPYIAVYYASGANTSGTVIWTISTACTKNDGSVTDDPSWIAEAAMGTQTMAAANRMWAQNAQLGGAMTNCVAGSTMYVKLVLSGTAASAVQVSKATVTVPRLLTVQAN